MHQMKFPIADMLAKNKSLKPECIIDLQKDNAKSTIVKAIMATSNISGADVEIQLRALGIDSYYVLLKMLGEYVNFKFVSLKGNTNTIRRVITMNNTAPIAAELAKHPERKPRCRMIGEDGNIYNLMGIASRALKGIPGAADEMIKRVKSSHSYTEALAIIMEYANVY